MHRQGNQTMQRGRRLVCFATALSLLLVLSASTLASAASSNRVHGKSSALTAARRRRYARNDDLATTILPHIASALRQLDDVKEEEDEHNCQDPHAWAITTPSRGGAAAATAAAAAAPQVTPPPPQRSALMVDLLHRLKIGFYFGLWYALNIIYNILNKKVLNILPAPLIVGSIQFGVGALYVLFLWFTGLRARPSGLSPALVADLRKVGFWHCSGQLFAMLSLGAGPVSFTHIVKALEPFFSAIVSALSFGVWMPIQVYLTLIPVVTGVGYACMKERSFSWLAFWTAMASNVAFAYRAVLSKVAMTTASTSAVKNFTSPNVFGLVTLAAFWISIPIGLLGEGRDFGELWNKAIETVKDTLQDKTVFAANRQLIQSIIVSGLFHYLNNEVMYLALGNVHPVTLAVGNTMKRVFIMVASVMVFRNTITLQSGIGSAVGIAGVLLYSLTKQYYEKLEKEQQQAAKAKLQQPSSSSKKK